MILGQAVSGSEHGSRCTTTKCDSDEVEDKRDGLDKGQDSPGESGENQGDEEGRGCRHLLGENTGDRGWILGKILEGVDETVGQCDDKERVLTFSLGGLLDLQ